MQRYARATVQTAAYAKPYPRTKGCSRSLQRYLNQCRSQSNRPLPEQRESAPRYAKEISPAVWWSAEKHVSTAITTSDHFPPMHHISLNYGDPRAQLQVFDHLLS
ncbi:hypothetical protein AC579_9059 [Pseudocercospora musae]|uniref:Uncharacterized protein n=1 Tax=Pseudocercospora musae TaxID=113226 RepID=A0A139ISH4_9PEZI|nr:hypothetical protein AC579_9059 [Pseudocercospora musae]